MAAISIPHPGKVVNGVEIGPCINPCHHIDCASIRRVSETPCGLCGEPIGYDINYFAGDTGLEHARCLYDKVEQQARSGAGAKNDPV